MFACATCTRALQNWHDVPETQWNTLEGRINFIRKSFSSYNPPPQKPIGIHIKLDSASVTGKQQLLCWQQTPIGRSIRMLKKWKVRVSSLSALTQTFWQLYTSLLLQSTLTIIWERSIRRTRLISVVWEVPWNFLLQECPRNFRRLWLILKWHNRHFWNAQKVVRCWHEPAALKISPSEAHDSKLIHKPN